MTTRQKRRQMQLRKKRIRRLKRRMKAYAARVAVLTILLLLCSLVIRGGLKLLRGSEKAEEAFAGARIVENGEVKQEGSPLIVLDAGHGGRDQGTSSGKALEKDINLAVVEKLAEELEKAGAAVLFTREDDTKIDLEARAEYANHHEAELFISIHCNYCEDDAGVKGLECYYREGSEEGEALADRIVQAMESTDRIGCRGTRIGDFRVLNKTKMPAVLVEIGYLSNQGECTRLTDETYQKLMAEKLAEGILSVSSSSP